MGQNLGRDQEMFNCSEKHEINYVASRYPGNEASVRQALEKGCASGAIKNFTHQQVYQYIQKVLGLAVP